MLLCTVTDSHASEDLESHYCLNFPLVIHHVCLAPPASCWPVQMEWSSWHLTSTSCLHPESWV